MTGIRWVVCDPGTKRKPAPPREIPAARPVLKARRMHLYDTLWEPLAVTFLGALLLIVSF